MAITPQDQVAFEIADRVHKQEKEGKYPPSKLTLLEISRRACSRFRSKDNTGNSVMIYSGRRTLSAAIYRSMRQQRSAPNEYIFSSNKCE
ncbi:unnamed protein product [Hymenolepis diminuta]|uniref:Uncharacterized protein n=1 Tax=Hymenolepis diminuta TaxID=6216 RepID=A0A564Y2D1_HYMDI|nr:unnamed protein product [Hymenolepis diminuta]